MYSKRRFGITIGSGWLLAACMGPQSQGTTTESPVAVAEPTPAAEIQAPTAAEEQAAQPEPVPETQAPEPEQQAKESRAPAPDQEGELLSDPTFKTGVGGWSVPLQRGTLEVVKENNQNVLRYVVEDPGPKKWSLQYCLGNIVIVNGRQYQLSLEARSGDPQIDNYQIIVGTSADGGKYQSTGLRRKINLSQQWQTYDLSFYGKGADENLSRICIDTINVPGIVDIRKVSLQPVE